MSEVVSTNHENIKAQDAVQAVFALDCPPTARAVAMAMIFTGARSVQQIMAVCGIPRSNAYRALSELAGCEGLETVERFATVSKSGIPAVSNVSDSGIPSVSISGNIEENGKKERSPTPPKEKTTYHLETTVSQSGARDDRQAEAGYAELKTSFNGSTEAMIGDVMRHMGPLARRQNAVNWLTATVSACGSARTAEAWAILNAKEAKGEIIPNPLALWAKTARGIKTEPATAPPKPKAKPGTFYRYGVVQ